MAKVRNPRAFMGQILKSVDRQTYSSPSEKMPKQDKTFMKYAIGVLLKHATELLWS